MRIAIAAMCLVFLSGCGGLTTGPSSSTGRIDLLNQYGGDYLCSVQSMAPMPDTILHAGDTTRMQFGFRLFSVMAPATAGIIFVRDDGSDNTIRFTFLPYVDNARFRQEATGLDMAQDGFDADFARGHEVNAFFIISKPERQWPPADGDDLIEFRPPRDGERYYQTVINWDKVAYKQFIRLGYRTDF